MDHRGEDDPRLIQIRETLSRVRQGDLAARVRRSDGADADAIDEIAEQINLTLERADELVTSLRDGTRILIHEMKYPFLAARSWMTRARQQMEDSTFRDELDRLVVQIDSARATTETMAEISLQIADRHDRRGFETVELVDVCAEVIMELADFAQARGQTLVPELQRATALGREHLLFVAIRNLVHNACTHSPRGAPIVLRCGEGRGGAWIEVEDRGVGLPPSVRDEVMSGESVALRQRDSRMAGGRGGMGLGLRLSKAIFRRHEATVRPVDRSPPPGTIMLIEFPPPAA